MYLQDPHFVFLCCSLMAYEYGGRRLVRLRVKRSGTTKCIWYIMFVVKVGVFSLPFVLDTVMWRFRLRAFSYELPEVKT